MRQKPLIYDFGMHIADDTEVYLKKGFRVVAVEADPLLCDQARKRFPDAVSIGDLIILNWAVGELEGILNFYVCNERTSLSTASKQVVKVQMLKNGVTYRTVPVEFTTADKILAQLGPARYTKIDIEGHDLMCLEQIARGEQAPDYLSFEVDVRTCHRAIETCRKMQFNRFALVSQSTVKGMQAPIPS